MLSSAFVHNLAHEQAVAPSRSALALPQYNIWLLAVRCSHAMSPTKNMEILRAETSAQSV